MPLNEIYEALQVPHSLDRVQWFSKFGSFSACVPFALLSLSICCGVPGR